MQEQRIFVAHLDAHLPNRFEKRQRFDVAHGAADFHQRDLRVARAGADAFLDFVGDVGNHLHRAAEVIAAPLFLNDALVYLSGGEVVALAHGGAHESLVVAEVEVGFRAVFGDEHLAVLKRAHGAGVNVDVGVEFQQRDFEAARFENAAQRSGGDALAQ